MNKNDDVLNLFYEEPDPDRWIKYDRYPRKLIRRIIRGKSRPGGVMMVALELMRGLDKLNIPYRYNDYKYAKRNPDKLIGVIGKPHLLFEKKFKNPILFGAGIFSHPLDCINFFEKYPNVKKMLVPGDWMKDMFKPYYGNKVMTWPVGIDTEKWHPQLKAHDLTTDFLIYDKVRWQHDYFQKELISPIISTLKANGLTFDTIQYGSYNHQELTEKIAKAKAVIFLCEHETQGLAYQQMLATGTPVLAWDRGGFWQDPNYYPDRVKYEPVSSVPYWDENCGLKFKDKTDFPSVLKKFLLKQNKNEFDPRSFILKNLTLEICALQYVTIYQSIQQ